MDWNNMEGIEHTVCCYLIKEDKVLMIFRNKKKKDINKNKWIGVGGHIEEGEEPLQAAIREIKEETHLNATKLVKKAIIIFNFNKKNYEIMHVFVCHEFNGRLSKNCNEGTLDWIPLDKLYDFPLWEGDRIFLEPVLNDEPFFEMCMEYNGDKLVRYERLNEI